MEIQNLTVNGILYARFKYDDQGNVYYNTVKHFALDAHENEHLIVRLVEAITGIDCQGIYQLQDDDVWVPKEGDKVTYKQTSEKGIVLRCDEPWAYVVFKCAGDWKNYKNYTAQRVFKDDILRGWPIGEQ